MGFIQNKKLGLLEAIEFSRVLPGGLRRIAARRLDKELHVRHVPGPGGSDIEIDTRTNRVIGGTLPAGSSIHDRRNYLQIFASGERQGDDE